MVKSSGSAWGKRLVIFIAKFLAVSLPLFTLWVLWGYFYVYPVSFLANSFVRILGFSLSRPPVPFDTCSSLIPFISLMTITGRQRIGKRFFGIAVGLLSLFLWHLAASMMLSLVTGDYQLKPSAITLSTALIACLYIFNLTLPFLLWFFLVGKNRITAAIL
jgi:hypothetical protein